MAFAQGTTIYRGVEGDLIKVIIPFTNGGSDTGGVINTGLKQVLGAFGYPVGSVAAANQVRVTTALPANSGSITIVTDADVDGQVVAWGRGY